MERERGRVSRWMINEEESERDERTSEEGTQVCHSRSFPPSLL